MICWFWKFLIDWKSIELFAMLLWILVTLMEVAVLCSMWNNRLICWVSLWCHMLQSTATSTSQHQGLMYCCLTPWLATILWSSVKALLLLSRGQATADRSFSVNTQLEVDKLMKMPLLPNVLFVTMWAPSAGCRTLIAATRNWQKYLAYLDDEKKKESSGRGEKSKALSDEIDELKKKKRCLQMDVDAMITSAD